MTAPAHAAARVDPLSTALAVVAVAAPALLAYNLSPSSTLLNQVLAFGGWGLWLAVGLRKAAPFAASLRATRALSLCLAVLAGAALWSWAFDALPFSLAASAVGMIAMAWFVMVAGVACAIGPTHGRGRDALLPEGGALTIEAVFASFAWALLVAGLASSAVAFVQVYAPAWPDGRWIARSGLAGRAVGNLRQPNHLASLLVWSLVALVFLAESRRLWRWAALACGAAITAAVVLTASRTGMLGIAILFLWGVFDRRLSRGARLALVAAPFVYGALWWAAAQWAHHTAHVFGGELRLGESDPSASRFRIWANTLSLIREHPWAGVGWGEFNFAWSLSVFPTRPVAFFDHTHNLPLQLAVELGLPLAGVVMLLLVFALWQAFRRSWARGWGDGADGAAVRTAFVLVTMIGAHSFVEYPLWYAYFLLPAAFAWGCALRVPPLAEDESGPDAARRQRAARRRVVPSAWPIVIGLAMAAAAVGTFYDYRRVSVIFAPPAEAAPLEVRILEGQRSIFFSHHADYAAATSAQTPNGPLEVFDGPTHYLLDTRLMIAWAEALAAHNDLERARYLAARLREFHNPASDAFFAECAQPRKATEPAPFQCEGPTSMLGWQDFR